jgi:hypothetical protein
MQICLALLATMVAIFLKSEPTIGKTSKALVYTKEKWLSHSGKHQRSNQNKK